jgi:hypothetical protein
VIALPALPTRSASVLEDDEAGLDELLDLCALETSAVPSHPALWTLRSRTHAYTQTWRHSLGQKGLGLGGPRRAW